MFFRTKTDCGAQSLPFLNAMGIVLPARKK